MTWTPQPCTTSIENFMAAGLKQPVATGGRLAVYLLGTPARAEHVTQLAELGQQIRDRPAPAVPADVHRLLDRLLVRLACEERDDVGLALLLRLVTEVAPDLMRGV